MDKLGKPVVLLHSESTYQYKCLLANYIQVSEVQKPSLLTSGRGKARHKDNKSQVVVRRNFWFSGDGLRVFLLGLLIAAWRSNNGFIGFIALLRCRLSCITVVELDRTIYLPYAHRISEDASLEFGK